MATESLWASSLIRFQRYIMHCETLRLEAIALNHKLQGSRLPTTHDEATKFFSAPMDNPLWGELGSDSS